MMRISPSESLVMEALWRSSPMGSEELTSLLRPDQDWSEATVRTLLRRLVAKGAVTTRAEGRRFLYSAAISRDDYVAAESRSLVGRLFGGSLASLVSHFAEREDLSEADVEELGRIVRKIEDER